MNNSVSSRRSFSTAFSKGLPAVLGNGFESRGGQVEMAAEIARCFEENRIAVIEAETGLGKSLAYLIPLLLHCGEEGVRAVISTHTRTLQHQLVRKDFPQACRAAGVDMEAVTLLGRTNYVCKKSVQLLLEEGGFEEKTREWLVQAYNDERGEMENIPRECGFDPAVIGGIACPSKETVCKGCRLRDECFLLQARRRAAASRIVFVNHALLFSDFSVGGSLLGPYDLLVADEAHHLHEVATDFFTLSFSPRSIKGSPQSLYSRAYEQVVAYVRDLVAAERPEAGAEIGALWKRFHTALESAYGAAVELFKRLSREARGHRLQGSAGPVLQGTSLRYYEGSPFLYGAESERDRIKEGLTHVLAAADSLYEIISGSSVLPDGEAAGMIRSLGSTAKETRETFDFILSAADETYVFYAATDMDGSVSTLAASPIDVSAQLGALFEQRSRSAILTSATLAVGGDFSYTLGRLGISGLSRIETLRYESPFDLERQRTVFLASFVPDPGEKNFIESVAETIEGVVSSVSKKTLVLCTSKNQLRHLSFRLTRSAALKDKVLAQDESASRNDLIDLFRKSRDKKVLFGLASFWEGIDFPGELLEIVVIVKMPFLVPTEPISMARAERIRARGEDPFLEFVLPDAVLKLRQGFGRLIRSGSDRGVVIVLDSRLKNRTYGDYVLDAVSNPVIRKESLEDLLMGIRGVFEPPRQR